MSKVFSYVDIATGRFTGRVIGTTVCTKPELTAYLQTKAIDGLRLVEGRYDRHRQRWDEATQSVVDDPELERAHATEKQRNEQQRKARTRIAALELQQLRPQRELVIDPTNKEAANRLREIDAQIALHRRTIQ